MNRKKVKRRGYKCIDYALLPIGNNDKLELEQEGYIFEYPYATHWLVQLSYSKERSPIINENYSFQYTITVFPCKKNGGTHTKSPIYIYFSKPVELDKILFKCRF